MHSASARNRAQMSSQALLDGKDQLLPSLVRKSKKTSMLSEETVSETSNLGPRTHFHVMLPSILASCSNLNLRQEANFLFTF